MAIQLFYRRTFHMLSVIPSACRGMLLFFRPGCCKQKHYIIPSIDPPYKSIPITSSYTCSPPLGLSFAACGTFGWSQSDHQKRIFHSPPLPIAGNTGPRQPSWGWCALIGVVLHFWGHWGQVESPLYVRWGNQWIERRKFYSYVSIIPHLTFHPEKMMVTDLSISWLAVGLQCQLLPDMRQHQCVGSWVGGVTW